MYNIYKVFLVYGSAPPLASYEAKHCMARFDILVIQGREMKDDPPYQGGNTYG